ncbi:kinase-like domain-containing protein [Lipomyces arxii]|uniref:kinase-like domain-containing protein n=1 Tax=Lipomyces arxii TaxID=56418 RepID=UPI0034CFA2BC
MTGPKIISTTISLQDTDAQAYATRQLLKDVFPSWSTDRIDVESLTGGITNCLLKCTHKAYTPQEMVVLVRAYGRGTGTIIDRNREFCTHMHLHSQGLAPPLYARFGNGLVYGFIPGRSVDYQELSNPILIKGVSRMLARWHTVLDGDVIRSLMAEQSGEEEDLIVNDVWQLCSKWISNLPSATQEQRDNIALLTRELEWVQSEIQFKGGPTVVAHCDLLSGNVLVPENWMPKSSTILPVTFIDYEYAMPVPRAFDLANHFREWQGFACRVSLIPEVGGPVMREWGKHYIEGGHYYKKGSSEVQQNGITVTEQEIDDLMNEIWAWWGMPGFYWGIWATIQAQISTIDFDYTSYAQNRLSEYWAWKKQYAVKDRKGSTSNSNL